MIKAIFFDYGGVFNREGQIVPFFEYCCKKYSKEMTSEFQIKAREIWECLRIGKSNDEKYFKFIADYFCVDEAEIIEDILDFFGNNSEMYEFAIELKKQYKLGMITNQIEEWFRNITHHYKFDEVFDSITTSYECGYAKPNIEIYRAAISKLDLMPAECIFIDDMQQNVDVACELGMRGILFENLEQLKSDLNTLLT